MPEHRMRQADDFDVEAVGVVPPVVEGRRGEHREAAPRRHETSERSAKAPHRDAGVLGFLRRAEGGRQNRVAAGDSGQHAREVDHHVRGRPEGVAADRDMPRDVPVTAEQVGGGGGGETPDIPGNRSGALGDDAARRRRAVEGRKWRRHYPWRLLRRRLYLECGRRPTT